jgi:hypothetical protein
VLGIGPALGAGRASAAPGETNAGAAAASGPRALEINHDPQLFIDDHLVDNRWGVGSEALLRVVHAPRKHEANPVIPDDGGYVNVARDRRTGLFKMLYQVFWDISYNPRKYTYATAYAESKDGVSWRRPSIGKHLFRGTRDNNVVMLGPAGGRAEGQFLLELPAEQRRGYDYVMLYGTDDPGQEGLHLIGSRDGMEWDPASDVRVGYDFQPDTQNSIVWDPQRRVYVMFTRATNLYADGESGPRRRVARLDHPELWGRWPVHPENILIPDERDERSGHRYFYGMPAKYYAGIYWGFLWPYDRERGDIYTELAYSRDGQRFERFAERPSLIGLGEGEAWDRGMVFASPGWVEVGDEWWIYYSGVNGGHSRRSEELKTGIGLARLRKEGFVSLRSPAGGGVVVTRLLRWPGGELEVNADAGRSELRVIITGYDRQPLDNFTPLPSLPLSGTSARQPVKWEKGRLSELKGRTLRLEFLLKGGVDLYGFRAAG